MSDTTSSDLDISNFLEFLSQPEKSLSSLLGDKSTENQEFLTKTCETLFNHIQQLAGRNTKLLQKTGRNPLSGLELYTGEDGDIDAEGLWGQIDVQNEALLKVLKRSVVRLSKAVDQEGDRRICLLEDAESDEESVPERASLSSEDAEDDRSSEEEEAEDEETRRIRERMEKAMEDMEDESEEDVEEKNEPTYADSEDESLEDPAKEELNDGFFDVQEMEAFADEEEAYLPDDAYEEEKPDTKSDGRSFHQRQRDGDLAGDSDVDDEEDDDLIFRKDITDRRKNFRPDDEVGALFELYEEPDSEEDDEIINMTAADLFGKPKQKYYENYKKRDQGTEPKDDDSWDGFEYETSTKQKKVTWNDASDEEAAEDESSESDEEEQPPLKDTPSSQKHSSSKYVKQSEKLKKQTEEIEKEMLSEKPWQMVGEVVSAARPVNSLLDSTPEFERASKEAPIMTAVETEELEEVIKRRILNEDWDDVVPRELPDIAWHQKKGELPEVSQEKSKLGLGELYEREYLKKAVGYDVEAAEKQTEEEKAKEEMRSLFASLCSKLDALSNYHFAPRPVAEEAEVRTVAKPAIAMEETLPLYVNDARTSAPEEIYGAKHGREAVIRSESELEQADRKRLRAAKKSARRKQRKAKEADDKLISRLQPGLGLNNPYEKRKMREELAVARSKGKVTDGGVDTNEYGKSGTFFQRMQDESQQKSQGLPPGISVEPKAKKQKRSEIYKM